MTETAPAAAIEVTEDALLDGRLRLRQPARGYRVAIDPVLLAAAVPAGPGERLLDLGCGAGAAALCLLARVPGAWAVGLERDPVLAALANENATLNGMGQRFEAVVGDVREPPWPRDAPGFDGGFDHVLCNPPHQAEASGTPSPDARRAAATRESGAGLADWIAAALALVRRKGSVTFIHRADRLDALLAGLHSGAGETVVFPLWPGPAESDAPAKRVIVRARKGVAGPGRLARGLVLHGPGGAYTPEAEAVLRHAQALAL